MLLDLNGALRAETPVSACYYGVLADAANAQHYQSIRQLRGSMILLDLDNAKPEFAVLPGAWADEELRVSMANISISSNQFKIGLV